MCAHCSLKKIPQRRKNITTAHILLSAIARQESSLGSASGSQHDHPKHCTLQTMAAVTPIGKPKFHNRFLQSLSSWENGSLRSHTSFNLSNFAAKSHVIPLSFSVVAVKPFSPTSLPSTPTQQNTSHCAGHVFCQNSKFSNVRRIIPISKVGHVLLHVEHTTSSPQCVLCVSKAKKKKSWKGVITFFCPILYVLKLCRK